MNFENLRLIAQKQLLKLENNRINLEQEIKNLESNLTSEENGKLYSNYKNYICSHC